MLSNIIFLEQSGFDTLPSCPVYQVLEICDRHVIYISILMSLGIASLLTTFSEVLRGPEMSVYQIEL
jgi:hypothetical protein